MTLRVNHRLLVKARALLHSKQMIDFTEDKIEEKIRVWINSCYEEHRHQKAGKRKTKQALADYCNVSKQATGQWFKTGQITKENLKKVAEFYGSSPDFLLTEIGVIERLADYNVSVGPDILGRVPLISWVQAGQWKEIIDNHQPGDAEEWRLTTSKVSKNAYALRIVGDSMTNPYGAPSLPPGSIVIIEPNRAAKHNDIVVARLDDSQEATIKRLIIDGSQRFLKPLNPQYPVISINGNCTICGVAIKVELDLL